MSQLNLKPDPIVLGVQAVVFLVNMFIVKKLMLEPYLTVRSRRDAQTGGSQDAAQKLQHEADALESKITERMRAAHKDAAQVRETIKKEALDKRATMLAKAESEAKAEQAKIETAIATNLKEERVRQDDTIKTISDQFFAQVIQ
jgi:F0F1-type ATP synthase membrane subunit b/b'